MKLTNHDYRIAPGYSRSQLFTLINKTPAHFKFELENPKADTPALLFGRAAHKYILEKDDFFSEYAILPDGIDKRTKEGKEKYAQFLEEAEGKTVISSDDFYQIELMYEMIRDNKHAKTYLTGDCEESFFWKDEKTGLDLKCRPDCLTKVGSRKYIVDYKTTSNIRDFRREAIKYGYDMQAAMYREGMFQNTFDDYGFVFVAQEKTEPYQVCVFECTEGFIQQGFDKFREAVGTLKYCLETDNWYGYGGEDEDIILLQEDFAND